MAPQAKNPFPIVGVGASAGGLSALTDLLDGLPSRPGLALVVVQHLDPHHRSRLPELLRAHTDMHVLEAAHGTKVEPDHVYVIQPNTSVAIADGALSVTERSKDRLPHYPVDHFLRSLAAVQGPHAIGVILSGTGSDGTLGICEIKAAGGVAFAQDIGTAQHTGMPESAAASGAVDLVLPPAEIAARLSALPRHPYLAASAVSEPGPSVDEAEEFQRVMAALHQTSGVDFSQYRDTTIKRRTARRMLLRGCSSASDYAALVERDPDEGRALYRDVLINVTSFFRDAQMFEDLKRDVFPEILKDKPEGKPVRVWVPGCSTGQEAYSIAILLLEYIDTVRRRHPIQIFATDLGDPVSLDRARAAVYPESIEADVSPERLLRFFTREGATYRINKDVRDLVVFARQNVTVDPPFSRVDLITCRNVLIYMSPALQQRLLPVFHFALNPAGFLVLGLAETVGSFDDLFALVNRTHKIYRKKESARRPLISFTVHDWLSGMSTPIPLPPAAPPAVDFVREAERLTLTRYAPPSVLINDDFEVQHFRGRTAPYLETPAGQPTTNLLRMAKEGLFVELRSALAEAKATQAPVEREHLHVSDGGVDVEFSLRILPVHPRQAGDAHWLVLFEPKDWPAWPAPPPPSADSTAERREVEWLREELASTRQYLQSIVDQQDAATHELRAAHEEVLSSNEELQSTNEELETTKEELQSANEELTTINEQFQMRNRELDALTDDLSNFISSADLALVMVGRDLGIRRLTPAAQRVFNLLPNDIGRSIEHIKFSLAVEDIGGIIREVVASARPWEREVTDRDGRWWMLRVLPYRTADGGLDGATLVAVDVDLIKRGHELERARDDAVAIVQTVREPLVVLDGDCRVGLANEAFYSAFGGSAETVEGRVPWDTDNVIWGAPALRRALTEACASGDPIVDLEVECVLPHRGRRVLVLNARPIVRAGEPRLLLLAIEDVTDARQAEWLRIDAETLRLLDRRKDEFLGTLAHELRNPLAPMRFALEVMRRPDANERDVARARQVLERQVGHLVRIVDDLLDVSRITQGKVELRREAVDLSSVVSSVVELCEPAIEAAKHTFAVSLPDERVTLDADYVRLTQLLVNLVNNAVKFTPPGGHIWLIAEKTGEDPGRPDQVRIRVRDTGIGISSEALPGVFEMFMQGDRSLERTRAGLGVGLTLVRNLVALHGGSVEVRSDGLGRGSEFTVCLPLDPDTQPAKPVEEASDAPAASTPLRILVADDNEDGREMLAYFLRSEGHEVAAAADGPAAAALAAEFRPDVAILDIGMPGMNGYAVAERLRASPETAPRLLVALSGLGQSEDKTRAVEAGFDHHFTKPVDIGALQSLLASISRIQDA